MDGMDGLDGWKRQLLFHRDAGMMPILALFLSSYTQYNAVGEPFHCFHVIQIVIIILSLPLTYSRSGSAIIQPLLA